ncbi:MAG: beta-lactamase regulating signal transducer with metallopeptidase domain [Pseudoalteromonas tetraodonis]
MIDGWKINPRTNETRNTTMNTIDTLLDWVAAGSLRASVLVLAVLAVQWVAKNRLPSRWRYALWLPVLAALLLPSLPVLPSWMKWSPQRAPVEIAARPSEVESGKTLAMATDFAPVAADKRHALPAAPLAASQPLTAGESPYWHSWITAAWLLGATAVCVCVITSFMFTFRRVRRTALPVDEETLSRIAETARSIGLRRMPRVLKSPAVASPAVCGLRWSTLLLNEGFPESLSGEESDMILRHELMHIRRGDLMMNALLCGLLALHWFNPLLWFAFFRVRTDREAACDAQVLDGATAPRRAAYAQTLLKMETAFPPSGMCLGFVGILQRQSALRERIQAIVSQPQSSRFAKAATALCIGLLIAAGVVKADEAPAKDKANAESSVSQGETAPEPLAIAADDSIAFFEDRYGVKLEGVKPRGEYGNPDEYYDEIAKKLGLQILASEAAAKIFSWGQDNKLSPPMSFVKRSPGGPWEIGVLRLPMAKEGKKLDFAASKTGKVAALVRIDDDKRILSVENSLIDDLSRKRFSKVFHPSGYYEKFDRVLAHVEANPKLQVIGTTLHEDTELEDFYITVRTRKGREVRLRFEEAHTRSINDLLGELKKVGMDIVGATQKPAGDTELPQAGKVWTSTHNRWPRDLDTSEVPANQSLEVFLNEHTASEFKGSIYRPNLSDWDDEDAYFKCGTEYQVEIRYKGTKSGKDYYLLKITHPQGDGVRTIPKRLIYEGAEVEVFRDDEYRICIRPRTIKFKNDLLQDAADGPATAPEAKAEGKEKPKPETKGRPQ